MEALRMTLAIHGGAGQTARSELTAERESRIQRGLQDALAAGGRILERGGNALDAAVAAVVVLEDCEVFNAGRGAVLRDDGGVVHDASVMRGRDRASGAVASVRRIRNPSLAALEVLREGRHVLLSGPGAESFAREHCVELVDPSYFIVAPTVRDDAGAGGTVGAVARDVNGGLAAVTSTGGMTGASACRIGDSPIVGAGTWADDATCAVSATGTGEHFVRSAFAHEVDAGMRLAGLDLDTACTRALARVRAVGGRGGCIAIDSAGRTCLRFDTLAMPRGIWTSGAAPRIAIFPGDEVPVRAVRHTHEE